MRYQAQIFIGGECFDQVEIDTCDESKLRDKYIGAERIEYQINYHLKDKLKAAGATYFSEIDNTDGSFFIQFDDWMIWDDIALKIIAAASAFGYSAGFYKAADKMTCLLLPR